MKLNKKSEIFILLTLLILSISCGKLQKLQKSTDLNEKYKAAVAYFDKKDYHRSGILFEELVPLLKGKEESEKSQLFYAYCQYYERQLTLSAYYFKRFYETYPRSEYLEEAIYMYCRSLYDDSPKYSLDQGNTQSAITAMQNFVKRYPQSTYYQQTADMIYSLRGKLEKKGYENAKLFHKIRNYKSALLCFDNFGVDFPESDKNEEFGYLKCDSQYQLAINSINEKKLERFTKTKNLYETFLDKFPNSKFLKPAEKLYIESIKQISILEKENSN